MNHEFNSKMNYIEAIKILQIEENFDNQVTIEIVKKKYKMCALIYHPDKNKSEDAAEQFCKIQNAYEYLMKYFHLDMEWKGDEFTNRSHPSFGSYKDLMFAFLRNIMEDGGGEPTHNLLIIVLQKLTQLCELKAFEFIDKLDKELLIKIYDILYRYYAVFGISEDFLLKIRKVLDNKLQNDSCIVLHPSLEDLLDDKVYRLIIDDNTFLIPLWHHELVYDISGADLYVRCFPILPDNVSINENNDIIIRSKYAIQELLHTKNISFNLAGKEYKKLSNILFISEKQKLLISNNGIAHIDTENIYNITKRSCIFAEIELY
jgi:hypothetical protein